MLSRDWLVTFVWRPGTDLAATVAQDMGLLDAIKEMRPQVYAKMTWRMLHSLCCQELIKLVREITDGWVIRRYGL